MDKVRVNAVYFYNPCNWDRLLVTRTQGNNLQVGDRVRVINLYGCPPANTMGQCYVVPADAVKDDRGIWDKDFCMVSVHSLQKEKPEVEAATKGAT